MKKISEALDQYTDICKEAIQDSAAKLSKSFEKVIIEVLLLYMVIPGKINFTQMGKYGRHGEQCYRQNFGRLRSKSLNWLRFNVSLARQRGSQGHSHRPELHQQGRQEDSAYWSFLVGVCGCRKARTGDNGAGLDRHRQP